MNKKIMYVFTAASLSILVPSPGRFALGLILVAELFFLMILTQLFLHFTKLDKTKEDTVFFVLGFLIALATLFKTLLSLLMPEVSIQLGYVLYLPPLAACLTNLFLSKVDSNKSEFHFPLNACFVFVLFALVFFLVRDIVGFGTITFILPSGIKEIVLFQEERISALTFFATIPGSLVCISLLLPFYNYL
ncbi:MAG: hypothetical protein IKI31_04425, partial [Treponema sp.]|nr:hypothetical protein [Treponema sp.]